MNPGRKSLAGLTSAVIAGAVPLSAAAGANASEVMTLKGFNAPGTPAQYNKVKVVKQVPKRAKRILVLVPGTSAGASNFGPVANGLLSKLNPQRSGSRTSLQPSRSRR